MNDKIRRSHAILCIDFDRKLSTESDEYSDFVSLMGAELEPRDMQKCNKPSQFIKSLEQAGKCGPGNYVPLREILSAFAKNEVLFQIIDTAEETNREARGLAMDMK